MSTESGRIIVPSTSFSSVRQAVQDADHQFKADVFAHTQRFWTSLSRRQQTKVVEYRSEKLHFLNSLPTETADDEAVVASVKALLNNKEVGPSRVLVSDMNYPNNRWTEFVHPSCSVVFDRSSRSVTWSTQDSRSRARATVVGRSLFAALRSIRWTRESGGVLTDPRGLPVEGFGYLGASEAPDATVPFVDSSGHLVEPS